MTSEPQSLELSIDTASALASIALTREGRLVAEQTWDCGRDQSRQLLPAIDALLGQHSASKGDLRAVFVCIGPGTYGGVRVGLSTAKGLAFGLDVPIVGVGRLEIDAYAFASYGGLVAAVHKAGRSDYAWAVYEGTGNEEQGTGPPQPLQAGWRELSRPRMTPSDELVDSLPDGALITGDIDDELAARLSGRGLRVARGAATVRRASLLAELARARLASGGTDDPNSLEPLYLREPAIGPQ
jgi:tRNA threonylcarbamoyladenosine biosynthesis protein TsaB